LGIFAHGDLGMAQGVIGSVGLDLVDDAPGLHGQVFGQSAGFLVGEDEVQVVGFEQGTMSVVGTTGLDGKTAVEIFRNSGQEGIAALDVLRYLASAVL